MTDTQHDQQTMPDPANNEEKDSNVSIDGQIERLYTIQKITAKLGALEDFDDLKKELLTEISTLYANRHTVLFLLDSEEIGLNFAGIQPTLENDDASERLKNSTIKTFNSDDETVQQLLKSAPILFDNGETSTAPLSELATLLKSNQLFLLRS